MAKAKRASAEKAYNAPTQPMKDVDVELIICRTTAGLTEEKSVRIEISDKLSRTRILEIAMTPAEFVDALFNRYASGVATIYVGSPWGLKAEHTKKLVWVHEGDYKAREGRAKLCVSQHETDGWLGRWEDADNPHNCKRRGVLKNGIKGDVYEVGFTRYVPVEETAG